MNGEKGHIVHAADTTERCGVERCQIFTILHIGLLKNYSGNPYESEQFSLELCTINTTFQTKHP
jgi:hypothetical protein